MAGDEQGRDQRHGQRQEQEEQEQEEEQTDQERMVQPLVPSGTADLVSVLYVVGGIPCLIAIFLILFLLTGACDQVNTFIPV